ncbi:alpha/beta hydrolase [Mycolicibacterium confluentis]|uniref:Lysophospholipase n=1 Tax=Mycolicibacterium confluentis TaxID=28047 RepID=A0A7I7Y0K2_9MYCO|nr:alpha/beta hydrolase [Mycolicibacterium confluentis]BBZ35117.1 lysophospholipase [Mycolicibacterium confluentis]
MTSDMNSVIDRYAAFLPAARRAPTAAPHSTWMPWRGRRVHIARGGDPTAPVRGILVHGGGGYSAALWPLAGLVAAEGVEVLAPDLPLYGYTEEPRPGAVRYSDWVHLMCDIIEAERRRDPRPIILFGASMGGMLAYEAAARTGGVAAVLATSLLDTEDPAVREAVARFPGGRFSDVALRAISPVVGSVRVPIRWLADMSAMSGDPGLATLCASDPRGGGARVPLGFLSSWLNFGHTPPERYRGAPVTLVAPAADAWTPPEVSLRFLQRISVTTATVMLENCGHYPIEEPGLTQLAEAGRETVRAVLEQAG